MMDTATNVITADTAPIPAAFADDDATTSNSAAPANKEDNDVIMKDEDNDVMMMAVMTDTKNNVATTATFCPLPKPPEFVFAATLAASTDMMKHAAAPTTNTHYRMNATLYFTVTKDDDYEHEDDGYCLDKPTEAKLLMMHMPMEAVSVTTEEAYRVLLHLFLFGCLPEEVYQFLIVL
eukprot:CAMPEP_0172481892 /NCGR_PEP_ID=MMETSP1066-20121228/8057_1 /TAXON_ID=671091 /ORGANISM="Coscinodiscus wailesii, Strain CCMP2513" /LENGTH=177 /DNA_ID=CAMNT_0013244587 /DNA_START=60 /DNA_END=589 /DNA_ORIENTATION=-